MIRIQLDGLPVSVNRARVGRWTDTKERGKYKRDVYAQVLGAGLAGLLLGSKAHPLQVEITYVFGPRSRNRDTLSNLEKTLLDALQSAGVIQDDRWIKRGIVASVNGPEDRTLIKLYEAPALTSEGMAAWWDREVPS